MTKAEKELIDFAALCDVRKSRDRAKMYLLCALLKLEREHGEEELDLVRLAVLQAIQDSKECGL
jgi:hypothetical protein